MFACLQPLPKENAPLARLRQWRNPMPPQMIRVNPPTGAPFFRLEVQQGRDGIPWNAVEQAAGRLRTRMLFPEGVNPPPQPATAAGKKSAATEPGIRPFEPKRLPALLALRAAQQVLRRCETPARHLSVALVDPRGLFTRSLEPLVPLVGNLRVYCPDFSLYRAAAALLLERYGMTLILSDSLGCFAQCDVVVAPELRLFTGRERGLIFTPDQDTPLPNCRVVLGVNPQLPKAAAALRPAGIDPLLFASALFELCAVKECEHLQFQAFCLPLREESFSIADLASLLDAPAPDFAVNNGPR